MLTRKSFTCLLSHSRPTVVKRSIHVRLPHCIARWLSATERPEDRHAYEGRRLPMNAFEAIILNETSGMQLCWLLLVRTVELWLFTVSRRCSVMTNHQGSICTPWAIKRSQLVFVYNFVKNKRILLQISLLDLEMNDACDGMNFTHLT